MTLAEEKEEIIKRISTENNLTVIQAIRGLIEAIYSDTLEAELNEAITEADNNKGEAHEDVWPELKKQLVK